MAKFAILILDEEPGQQLGVQLKAFLQTETAYHTNLVSSTTNVTQAVKNNSPHLVITVLPASRNKTLEIFAQTRAACADAPILPVVRVDSSAEIFDDLLSWTDDFLTTPLRQKEVCARVRRFTAAKQREAAASDISEACGLAQLIGEDPAFMSLKRKISLVARSESTVLLTGETGTGKERCARALHYLSRRSGKPFLPVNCGAVPVELFESELYGHQKGAFTGAVAARQGLIAEAEGGTLMLDEIETLSMAAQVKLLRFLQDQTYYAVGSAKPRQANVWIIASTNVELPLMIKEGSFREDLYYRLAVIRLDLPPLRERHADIRLLASHFWSMHAARAGRSDLQLSAEVMDALCRHPWPGNVRELENVIQQLAVLTESHEVTPEDVPLPRSNGNKSNSHSFAEKKADAIEEFERSYITELMRTHGGNVTRAASEAKKDRRALGRLIKKYQIVKS